MRLYNMAALSRTRTWSNPSQSESFLKISDLRRMDKAVSYKIPALSSTVTFPPIWRNLYCSKKQWSRHSKWHRDKRKGSSPDKVWLPGSNCSWGPTTFLSFPLLGYLPSLYSFTQQILGLFLKLPQIGFLALKKKCISIITTSRRFFFFFLQMGLDLFFLFQIPPHYLWEGGKILWACRGMCNENSKDTCIQVKRI